MGIGVVRCIQLNSGQRVKTEFMEPVFIIPPYDEPENVKQKDKFNTYPDT